MRRRRRAYAFLVSLALGAGAIATSGACGVVVDIESRDALDGAPPGETGASGEGGVTTDGGAPTSTNFGDATVVTPSDILLVAGEAATPFHVRLDRDPSNPAVLAANITVDATTVTVSSAGGSETTADFTLRAAPNSTPLLVTGTIHAAVGGIEKNIPFDVRIARYFRTPIAIDIPFPVASPTTYEVVLWGAGGGNAPSGPVGGAGGYARATANLTGDVAVYVGSPGTTAAGGAPGGGAPGGGGTAGGGGGYSAIVRGVKAITPTQPDVIIIAPGGGGAGVGFSGGAGGQRGYSGAGVGGWQATTTAYGLPGGGDATSGSALQGGAGNTPSASAGGGGGGGYFGGGGGGPSSGGGGGSSFGITATSPEIGDGGTPGNATHPLRENAGEPGVAGAVLITPNPRP